MNNKIDIIFFLKVSYSYLWNV